MLIHRFLGSLGFWTEFTCVFFSHPAKLVMIRRFIHVPGSQGVLNLPRRGVPERVWAGSGAYRVALAASHSSPSGPLATTKVAKKGMVSLIREGLRHVYHGFRLFLMNTRLAWRYSRQLKKGVALTRRERILLESSTKDFIRLVPFSFFIVVPFAELLLPVALKMFPGLIPSTFETESQGRNRAFGEAYKTLRARQRLTEFLSASAIALFTPEQQEVVRRSVFGEAITPSDIRLVAPHFSDSGPFNVYKLPDYVVQNLSRVLGVHRWYYNLLPSRVTANMMRRGILRNFHSVREDDRFLRVEGLDDLTHEELLLANQRRGMRWTENTETLRIQLEWWSALARDPNVPFSTLFWLKPTRYTLRKSLNSLPLTQRRQLLGIQSLPETVHSSLEALCETVDSVTQIENGGTTADELAEKVEDINKIVNLIDRDIDVQGIAHVLGEYLSAANIRQMFASIREKKLEEEDVVLSDVIDYLGRHLHHSTHVVSTVFDGFDYGAGSKPITEKALLAIGARCRAVVQSKAPTEKANKKKVPEPSTEKKAETSVSS